MTVAAHLWGMRPDPTRKKDTLMLREKLKHWHYYSNSSLFTIRLFLTIVHIYRYVSNTYQEHMYTNIVVRILNATLH